MWGRTQAITSPGVKDHLCREQQSSCFQRGGAFCFHSQQPEASPLALEAIQRFADPGSEGELFVVPKACL